MIGMAGKGTRRRTIRIADEVWDPAAEKAEAEGTSVSEIVRDSLVAYVENTAPEA